MLLSFAKIMQGFILMQKHLENGLNRGGEIFGALFHEKIPFPANIKCCPKFLEYALLRLRFFKII